MFTRIAAIALTTLILWLVPHPSDLFAGKRDEFPGRRQGGGTHWVTPMG